LVKFQLKFYFLYAKQKYRLFIGRISLERSWDVNETVKARPRVMGSNMDYIIEKKYLEKKALKAIFLEAVA
jgi:hypothetical protein